MSHFLEQGTAQTPAPPAPPRPVNPNELSDRINQAVNEALSQVNDGQTDNARQSLKEALDQVKAELEAARAEGRTVTIQPQFDTENMIPPQAVDISVSFFVMVAFIIVGLPLARAFARRMDRRGETASASQITPRLDRIEQAVEAIAIEVERVSEGQRYTTKAISELRGLPAGNPIGGWPAGAREAERVPAGESTRRP
jgi:vacuolar-type H+-ATPase subunit I/STV1